MTMTVTKKVDWQQLLQTVAIVCSLLVVAGGMERRVTVVEEQHRYMIQMPEKQNQIVDRLIERIEQREYAK